MPDHGRCCGLGEEFGFYSKYLESFNREEADSVLHFRKNPLDAIWRMKYNEVHVKVTWNSQGQW